MQLLLVRHALPLRTRAGEGSDPELAPDGLEQARRLPAALARFPLSRLISSPQRRAVQTAEPVARATGLAVDYASVTVLRHSRKGAFTVGGVNAIEHVWDLLPHRLR